MLLVILLFAALGATPASAASDGAPLPIPTTGDIWDGSIERPETLVQRDGIYYYEITKCSQLAYVAQTGGDWLTYNYILENNLILNDVVLTWDEEGNCTNTEELLEWTPIGDFNGKFLGNGYSISGMHISTESLSSSLFRTLGRWGSIDSITVVNSYIMNKGSSDTGGLVGDAHGTISNCSIVNSHVNGNDYVGGLVGRGNRGVTIRTYYNYGNIEGNANVGGIVGFSTDEGLARCQIENCFNLGIIIENENVGGIVGSAYYSDISSCYNAGTGNGATNQGAIVGKSDHFLGERSEITNCYYLKDSAHNLDPFGNVSGDTSGVAEGLTDAQMKQQASFVNWNFD